MLCRHNIQYKRRQGLTGDGDGDYIDEKTKNKIPTQTALRY